jgi:radical SAM protein with 4Fe4S-binding SPASM domain
MNLKRLRIEGRLRNHYWAQKAYFWWKMRQEWPLNLNIEVTNHCNLRCIMCPRHLTNRGYGFIDEQLYGKIIDEVVREGGVETLTLIKDGEPLLHPKLDELIAYAKKWRAAKKIEIFTNGFYLNQNQWGERMVKSGLDLMNVSIDAATRETYKKIRGVDVFDQVVDNVKEFAKLKKRMKAKSPRLIVRVVGLKANEEEIDQIKEMWRGIVDYVGVTPFTNYGGGVANELGGSNGEGGMFKKGLEVLGKGWGKGNAERAKGNEKAEGKGVKGQAKGEGVSGQAGRYPCPVLWFNPVVNWDGEVTTCCVNYMRNELIIGDVKKQSLKEIWNGEKLRKIRQAHVKGDFSELPTCAKCTYWKKFADLGRLAK